MKKFLTALLFLTVLNIACQTTNLPLTYLDNFNIDNMDGGNQGIDDDQQVDSPAFEYLILESLPDPNPMICPQQDFGFVTDLNVYQTPDFPEPQSRKPFLDPIFGTCIVRVTDRQNDFLNPNDISEGLKNEYARVQSFNANGSFLMVRSIESFWYVYDAYTLLSLGEVPVNAEPRWDAKNPYLFHYTDDSRLMSYNLNTGAVTVVRDFLDDFSQEQGISIWTRYEGSPSYDSRYWGFLAQDSEWETIAFLIYDLKRDDLVARELPSGYSIDNVTISPLGNYFLASFDNTCQRGQLGSDENPCGLMVYDHNLENGRSLLRIIGHYDALLDTEGKEVILYQDIDTDNISMLDLESGQVTPLFPIDFGNSAIGFHFSGRASNQPGWGLVSTYNGGYPKDHTWMDDSIFAVEMKKNGRVVRLAHTHTRYDEDIEQDYWAEPHASVNRDFTRIVFTSNWGRNGTGQVDLYMILLPEKWVERLP